MADRHLTRGEMAPTPAPSGPLAQHQARFVPAEPRRTRRRQTCRLAGNQCEIGAAWKRTSKRTPCITR